MMLSEKYPDQEIYERKLPEEKPDRIILICENEH